MTPALHICNTFVTHLWHPFYAFVTPLVTPSLHCCNSYYYNFDAFLFCGILSGFRFVAFCPVALCPVAFCPGFVFCTMSLACVCVCVCAYTLFTSILEKFCWGNVHNCIVYRYYRIITLTLCFRISCTIRDTDCCAHTNLILRGAARVLI